MILDNANVIARQDASGAIPQVLGYARQASEAISRLADGPLAELSVSSVVIVGFGTSGAAADAIAAYASFCAPVPIAVVKDKRLPSFAGPSTLVIVASYSGDTSDCVYAYREALKRGATVAAVTSGGSLEVLAKECGGFVSVEEGLTAQFCLPEMFYALYGVLVSYGVVARDRQGELETLGALGRQNNLFSPDIPETANPAKQIASALLGKLPVIYAGSGWLDCVARRWVAQINACGKLQAHSNSYPELTHNELLSWRNAGKQSQQWAVVLVRDRAEDPAGAARVSAAADAIPVDIDVHEVYAEGKSLMSRLWTALAFADLASAYLAIAWGEDPSVG